MNDEQLLVAIAGAHRAAEGWPDAAELPRVRALPRHRARRPRWKPESTTRLAQHASEDRTAQV